MVDRVSVQQASLIKSSANEFGRRRSDRNMATVSENKPQPGKASNNRVTSGGKMTGIKDGGSGSVSRDRLVYITTCLIGHDVEVQVKDGSIYTGIFHATNAENDFGIILKIARLKYSTKPPSKVLIIPADELVQVKAKDVPITMDGLKSGRSQDKEQDIVLDSCISSNSHHLDMEMELEPWVADDGDTQCQELENMFAGPWNRKWDQFETNEALFGVKSTFDEEIYTTKLEKGPHMLELEKEALRIAREIEAEETRDFHLAEERGKLDEDVDIDEETKYSSVSRRVDDSMHDDSEETAVDSCNNETFGSSFSLVNSSFHDASTCKKTDGCLVSPHSPTVDDADSGTSLRSPQEYEAMSDVSSSLEGKIGVQDNVPASNTMSETVENGEQPLRSEAHINSMKERNSANVKKEVPEKGMLSPNAAEYAPESRTIRKTPSITDSRGESESSRVAKFHGAAESETCPGISTLTTAGSGCRDAPNTSTLSRSSSISSLASEKSTLNPKAKEFKLNPHARSFLPCQTAMRSQSPVPDVSFYVPANVPPVQTMHSVPVGFGVGPTFTGHQSVVLNQHGAVSLPNQQTYFHSNVPQYGQQMFLAHPRSVVYVPSYHPEVPYKGRDY